ncbi:DUF1826 domain-containing protein [Zoogloea sp.]|uniref:DUF1826 domain-containing protein n=1 Tax=Zoogloea sp. TaxID=49181 RepID=UPI002623A5D4|nr:DUF1826 domain-containing protein [Zoogloea sp.]MDD3354842.1 DUF1826 domain-containing protein [Zoogloea sp.]
MKDRISGTARHTIRSSHPAELTGIFDPGTQIALWERPEDPAIVRYLNTHHRPLGCGVRGLMNPGCPPNLDDLPAGDGRNALAADMAALAELLTDLLGCPQVGFRLEVIDRAMCPRFHVDRVGIRLLCTYRGPGTEWIDDGEADRSRLGAGAPGLPDGSSGLMPPSTPIEAATAFQVALLKGSLWQGNTRRGVIHRSPAVPEATLPRVVLALDAIWEER